MCEHVGYTDAARTGLSADAEVPTVAAFHPRARWTVAADCLHGDLPLPRRGQLCQVELSGLTGETPPESVTWWLTADDLGAQPLTDKTSTDWVTSPRSLGGCTARVDVVWTDRTRAASVYVWIVASGATDVVVRPRLVWHTLAARDLTPEHRARIAQGD